MHYANRGAAYEIESTNDDRGGVDASNVVSMKPEQLAMRRLEARRRALLYVDVAIGTVLISCLALLISALLYGSSAKFIAPTAFVAVIVLAARRFGTLTGVLGTLASALVFACFLYTPFGNAHIDSPAAREGIQWLLLGGISLSFLFPPASNTAQRRRKDEQQQG